MPIEMMTTILTAVFSGFITALVIESIRYANERNKIKDSRDFEHRKALQAFIAEANENVIPPIARLLISTPSKIEKTKRVKKRKGTQQIFETKEIKDPIIQTIDDRPLWAKILAVIGIKTEPNLIEKVYRTYFRQIPNDSRSYVWDTRDKVALLGELTTIGRNDENNIVLETILVSRLHAVIRFENGHYVLYNLTITNPVLVNDQDIEYKSTLQDGDVIEFFGSYLIEFQQR